MTRRLVVDASVVVDLLGRFRPEPIEALLFAADAALVTREDRLARAGSRDRGPGALKLLAEPQRARAALLPKGLSLQLRH